MDQAPWTRRTRSARSRRRACLAATLEALEGRTLLAASLLKVINPVNTVPAEIAGAGGAAYFVNDLPGGRAELEVKSAAGVTVLKDVPAPVGNTGSPDAIYDLTPAGTKLFFVVSPGPGNDRQIWVTDGTKTGTSELKDPHLDPIAVYPNIVHLTAVGGELFFTVKSGSPLGLSEYALWKSDGTVKGTVKVAPAANAGYGYSSSYADDMVSHGGTLYFSLGNQLLETDGGVPTVVTTIGTAQSISNLTDAGSLLYFTADDSSGGLHLYASDGTASGTRKLQDYQAAGSNSYAPSVGDMTAAGSRLFFAVDDPAHGSSLWQSDGTVAGTTLLKTLSDPPPPNQQGPNGDSMYTFASPILAPTAVGGRLFFVTQSASTGAALWVSDGTAAGTTRLASIQPAQLVHGLGSYLAPGQFAAFNGLLYFANSDRAHGMELWQSDGSVAGTHIVGDLVPGRAGSYPGKLTETGGTLYFSGATAGGRSAVWASDGTAAGTKVAVRVGPEITSDAFPGPIASTSALAGGTLFFAANDGTHGTALWRSDGTRAGTRMVKVLTPGPYASYPGNFTAVGGRVFFTPSASGNSTESLWVSDGTAGGTRELDTFGSVLAPTAFDGKLAFLASSPSGTTLALWTSDGTARGTKLVKSFPDSSAYGTMASGSMVALGGTLYLVDPGKRGAQDSSSLWVSDGTTAGTRPLEAKPAFSGADNLVVDQGRVYFTADPSAPAVWVTDGTAAGTKQLASLGPDATAVSLLLAAGPRLFIEASSSSKPEEQLYAVDPATGGTVLLHSFANVSAITKPFALANGHMAVGFQSSGGTFRTWLSDGTAAGTVLAPIGAAVPVGAFGGRLFLAGIQGTSTTGLWQSDGTAAGTMPLQGLTPVASAGSFVPMAALRGRLIVADGGRLMSVTLPPLPATAHPAPAPIPEPVLTPREAARERRLARIEAIRERRIQRLKDARARWIARIEHRREHHPSGL